VLLKILNFILDLPKFLLVLQDQSSVLAILAIQSCDLIHQEIVVDPLLFVLVLQLPVKYIDPIKLLLQSHFLSDYHSNFQIKFLHLVFIIRILGLQSIDLFGISL